MHTVLDPEIQSPLLHHGLVHLLYPSEISVVYAACMGLRDTIEGDRAWLNGNCQHLKPHSYGDVPVVDELGNQDWYRDGKLHRDNDLPAMIRALGTQKWYKDGKLHREGDLPAVIWANGTQNWYKYGKQHRDGDLPAEIILASGAQRWYIEGKQHRDNDLPATIWADGSQCWYKDGKRQSRYWLIRRVCW